MIAAMMKNPSSMLNVSFMTAPANETDSVWTSQMKDEPGRMGDFTEGAGKRMRAHPLGKAEKQMGLTQEVACCFWLVFQLQHFEVGGYAARKFPVNGIAHTHA